MTRTRYVPVAGNSSAMNSGFVPVSFVASSTLVGLYSSSTMSGIDVPVVVVSPSTKTMTAWPAVPLNVKSAEPPVGTVPVPDANGAPTAVGGFESYGSFHCRTTLLLLPGLTVNWTVCAMSTVLLPP